MAEVDERERLQNLHMALESAVEQLTYAQRFATVGSEIGQAPPEVATIEKLLNEIVQLRNETRERLLKVLSRPTLKVYKGPDFIK